MQLPNIRAWDSVAKVMTYGASEQFDDMIGFRFHHFECDDPDYMLGTGLLDKDQHEAFNGDIVQDVDGRNYLIFWRSDLARYALSTSLEENDSHIVSKYLLNKFTVVGNKFETPHLMDNKQ